MKFEMAIRSRPITSQAMEVKHNEFCHFLSRELHWGFKTQEIHTIPIKKEEFISQAKLTDLLHSGVRGNIWYASRDGVQDKAMYDDFLDFEFNLKKVDYDYLLGGGIQKYLHDFSAYYAHIGNRDFFRIDFERMQKKNLRQGIYRIFQVTFIDAVLCERSFQRKPSDVIAAVKDLVYHAELVNGGVLIMLSPKPLLPAEENEIGEKVREFLLPTSEV